MYCSKCGKQISETDKFCPECGQPQYGNPKPDSEFRQWLNQRRMLWTVMGAVLVIFGVIIKKPQLAMIGALMATISLMALSKDDK
jgi:uncharacterized membrane protein YvbJ